MIAIIKKVKHSISPEQLFMISVLLVNGGNYLYNLILGRILGPKQFADAAILITFLLVLSFVAMTFQLTTAKFSVLFNHRVFKIFIGNIYKIAIITSIILGLLIVFNANYLQDIFKTSSKKMFTVFGLAVPFYFIMSVNRGVFQGKNMLQFLSISYQAEMISRLLITISLLYFLNIESSLVIAIGILCSLIIGLIPFNFKNFSFKKHGVLNVSYKKQIRNFIAITAFYELTQIIINNSDILLVKHYFNSLDAGLYASLALIGRVVYFIAWMFVMLLLPTVVQLKKEGKQTTHILIKYVFYISLIAIFIIIVTYIFPNTIVNILFGSQFLEISHLLWKYALATGIFAVSNIFAYYYLSLDRYLPVILSGILGSLQIICIMLFHNNIEQVIHVQIIVMILLLIMQLAFFFIDIKKSKH